MHYEYATATFYLEFTSFKFINEYDELMYKAGFEHAWYDRTVEMLFKVYRREIKELT